MRDDNPLKVQIGQIWIRKSHTGILSTWRVDEEKPGVGWKCTCLTAEAGGAFTAGSRHFWAMKSASVWTLEPAAPVQEVRVGQHWLWGRDERLLVVEELKRNNQVVYYRMGDERSCTTIEALRGMARLVKDVPTDAQEPKIGQVWEFPSGKLRTVDRIDLERQMVGFVDNTALVSIATLKRALLVLEKVAPTVPSVYVPKVTPEQIASAALYCPTTCTLLTPCERNQCRATRHLWAERQISEQMVWKDARLPAPPKPLTTGIQPTRYGFAFTRIDGRARR